MLTKRQHDFIEHKIKSLLTFLNSRDRKIKNISSDLYCENEKDKKLIGIDYHFLGSKKKGIYLTLFWGRYKKLNSIDDQLEAIDNDSTQESNLTIDNKSDFRVIEIIAKTLNDGLSALK